MVSIERNIIAKLRQWRARSDRKPLILRGARQTGKTTAITNFGREFARFIHLNLDRASDLALFTEEVDLNLLLKMICLHKRVPHDGAETLLFIDEIQNSEVALKMLRFFHEEKPENLFVVAAGSLLEIMLARKKISFPVGRVEFLYLFPVTFAEYLQAKNETLLVDAFHKVPLAPEALAPLLSEFHQYAQIGGMPEIVAQYLEGRSVVELEKSYADLFQTFIDDVHKYSEDSGQAYKLKTLLERAPLQAGMRIKFENFGRSGFKSRDVGEGLRILERAMLIKLVYPTTSLQAPFVADQSRSPKLQVLDTGLINFKANLFNQYFNLKSLEGLYQGTILEHLVRQELLGADSSLPEPAPFWVRDKAGASAEIDFLFDIDGRPLPVELKSHVSGRLRSLHFFMDHSDATQAIRLYPGPYKIEELVSPQNKRFQLINVPYFHASRIREYLPIA